MSAYYIIVSNEGTSTKPKKHGSFDEATKEAQRLATLKPGVEFTVFKALDTYKQPPVAVEKTHHADDVLGVRHYTYSYMNSAAQSLYERPTCVGAARWL